MSGFSPRFTEQLAGRLKYALAGNTITAKIGDAIKPDNSNFGVVTNASVAGSTTAILGVVWGFTDANQTVLNNGDVTSFATGSGGTTYLAYIPAWPNVEFFAPLSAVSGTTTGSNKPLVYFNLSDETKLDETSVTHPATTTGQFLSFGVDPNNTSQVVGYFAINTFATWNGIF